MNQEWPSRAACSAWRRYFSAIKAKVVRLGVLDVKRLSRSYFAAKAVFTSTNVRFSMVSIRWVIQKFGKPVSVPGASVVANSTAQSPFTNHRQGQIIDTSYSVTPAMKTHYGIFTSNDRNSINKRESVDRSPSRSDSVRSSPTSASSHAVEGVKLGDRDRLDPPVHPLDSHPPHMPAHPLKKKLIVRPCA